MKSKNVTVTDARVKQAFHNRVTEVIDSVVPEMINRAVENASVRTGVVTKVYHYLDKFEVKLDNSNQKVLCKRLHLFGKDLIDLYTPLADSYGINDKTKEPYYIPRFELHCAVLNIHDDDSNEHLLLGFYPNEELIGLNPAKPGNLKLTSLCSENNQFWIKFGRDGLDLRLPKPLLTKVGDLDKNMEDITYADSTKVYTKEECYNKQEVYTKEEVDELIREKVAEAIEEIQEENGNNDTTG